MAKVRVKWFLLANEEAVTLQALLGTSIFKMHNPAWENPKPF